VPGALERLEAAGIDVRTGVCEAEATDLIRDFAKHITTGMPYVTLKAAVTLDGKMATRTGDSRWITGERARRHAHRMRAESDAVLVGAGTVAADDPQLTVRHVRGPSPLRIVVDPSLRTPAGAMVLEPTRGDAPSPGPSVLFHAARARADRRDALAARATLIEVPEAEGGLDLTAVLRELGRRDVVRLLVEGGPTLHGALLDAGLVDRLAVFVAPRIIGDAEAPSLARGRGVERVRDALAIERLRTRRLGHDVLFEGPVARWKPAEG
jgi:diaminohydroxyphosphoribosylaminopyrimidine deaminase/5-amino-6-(5-phosphoribosylamino)uracil reductase